MSFKNEKNNENQKEKIIIKTHDKIEAIKSKIKKTKINRKKVNFKMPKMSSVKKKGLGSKKTNLKNRCSEILLKVKGSLKFSFKGAPDEIKGLKLNKKVALAVSFSIMMMVIGSVAFFEYMDKRDSEGQNIIAGGNLSSVIVAQNNPLIVSATSITENPVVNDSKLFVDSSEIQYNTVGKISLNPAVSALVALENEDENKPKLGDAVDVSLAPSMVNMQKDLNDVQLFDSKKDVYEMMINGKLVATFYNPDDARLVVDKIVEINTGGSADIINVEYKEELEINKTKKSFLSMESPSTVDDAVSYLLTGTKERQKYTVVAGDIPESIAEENGISVDDLYAANPQIVGKGHLLQIGQDLDLVVPVPMLTVVTTERVDYNEDIDFNTVEEGNADMYEGQTRVKVAGVKGKKQVVAQVVRENGAEVSRELVSEEVVSEPVDEVLIVGTRKTPPKKGTGTFMVPLSRGYVISSPFGWRWGALHTGLDMACPTGTPIYASDGGVVTYAGWQGSYGYLVEIDHGGNYKTRYAHCSALHVGEGQQVFQGQHIANVGSTGNSTGAHVHFEVINNGVQVDPSAYIY